MNLRNCLKYKYCFKFDISKFGLKDWMRRFPNDIYGLRSPQSYTSSVTKYQVLVILIILRYFLLEILKKTRLKLKERFLNCYFEIPTK